MSRFALLMITVTVLLALACNDQVLVDITESDIHVETSDGQRVRVPMGAVRFNGLENLPTPTPTPTPTPIPTATPTSYPYGLRIWVEPGKLCFDWPADGYFYVSAYPVGDGYSDRDTMSSDGQGCIFENDDFPTADRTYDVKALVLTGPYGADGTVWIDTVEAGIFIIPTFSLPISPIKPPVVVDVDALPLAKSPAPRWIFAGNVTEEDQDWLQKEMGRIRAFFSDRYSVEATGFTVLAGEYEREANGRAHPVEEVERMYRKVTGSQLPTHNPHVTGNGKVLFLPVSHGRSTEDGGITWQELPFGVDDSVTIAHEYFHVLQHQMAGTFNGPYWLVEGAAVLASFNYAGGLGSFAPYEEIAWQRIQWDEGTPLEAADIGEDLAFVEPRANWFAYCETDDNQRRYGYAIAFLASYYLTEEVAKSADSYVTYWQLHGQGMAHTETFEEAFGITLEDAYTRIRKWFDETEVTPEWSTLRINMAVPEGYCDKPDCLLWVTVNSKYDPFQGSLKWQASGDWGTHDTTIAYESDQSFTVTLSLRRQEQHIGYYGNGKLVDREDGATPIHLTGVDTTIEWLIDRASP